MRSAAYEGQCLFRSDGHRCRGSCGSVNSRPLLTWEIGSGGVEGGVGQGVGTIRGWSSEFHVTLNACCKVGGSCHDEGFGVEHFVCFVDDPT